MPPPYPLQVGDKTVKAYTNNIRKWATGAAVPQLIPLQKAVAKSGATEFLTDIKKHEKLLQGVPCPPHAHVLHVPPCRSKRCHGEAGPHTRVSQGLERAEDASRLAHCRALPCTLALVVVTSGQSQPAGNLPEIVVWQWCICVIVVCCICWLFIVSLSCPPTVNCSCDCQ